MFRHGILFLLSAPSGAGKSTLRAGLAQWADFGYSVSCTTRPPRPGEADGVDYHFLSPPEFERRLAAGEFLEHALVHGQRYGTPKGEVLARLRAGGDVLLEIDTQGAEQIRTCADGEVRAALVDIFVLPPSPGELRRRLAGRGTEPPEQVALRLANAEGEIAHWRRYRYAIVSGSPLEDLERLRAIMVAERARARRLVFEPGAPYA